MSLADVASGDLGVSVLLDRERELGAIERLFGLASEGRGCMAVIEGPAGIGKTSLLGAAAFIARERGFTVLQARGTPLERDYSFGVVRQLYEPLALDADERVSAELFSGAAALSLNALSNDVKDAGVSSEDLFFTALHGLFWLTANLASTTPVLVVADDCQWADSPSLRFLAHLGARLDGLSLLVLVGLRAGEPGPEAELLTHALSFMTGDPVRPDPLGPESTAGLIRTELGATATDSFCNACHAATGGNPLLLHTLVASIAAEGGEASDEAAANVTEFGVESVARLLTRQLANLPQGSEACARALSVLGTGAPLRHVAELAGVELERAAEIVDSLRAASILERGKELDFAHPILRVAVYDGIGADARGLAHAAAADLLAAEGAPPDRIALHLLQAQPRGDTAVVDCLRAAARQASDRGAPETAASYLRRGLEEPPAPAARPGLLLDLGQALMARRDPEAIGHLREAIRLTEEPADRLTAALAAGRALGVGGFFEEAAGILELALDEMDGGEEETRLLLEAELLPNWWLMPERPLAAAERLARLPHPEEIADPARSLLEVNLAYAGLRAGDPAEVARGLLERALADPQLLRQESLVLIFLVMGLIWIDRLDAAEQICAGMAREGQRRGSASLCANTFPRALALYRRGWLRDAEAEARSSFEQKVGMHSVEGIVWPLSFLVDALVAQGDLEGAERALEEGEVPENPPESMGWAILLEARGRLRVAQGRVREGLEDLLESGRRWQSIGWHSPVSSMWRGDTALAHAQLGEQEESRRLAAELLELARPVGLQPLHGIAARVAGQVAPRAEAIPMLRDAVEILEPTSARLELGRALVELGSALRRAGHRSEARDHLRRGLELATRSGALPLAQRARDELIAVGDRPRRPFFTGVEALTASELRVARLAAQGMGNRAIAESLFVTQRTVETHLQHVFQKLSISGRQELPSDLAAPPAM